MLIFHPQVFLRAKPNRLWAKSGKRNEQSDLEVRVVIITYLLIVIEISQPVRIVYLYLNRARDIQPRNPKLNPHVTHTFFFTSRLYRIQYGGVFFFSCLGNKPHCRLRKPVVAQDVNLVNNTRLDGNLFALCPDGYRHLRTSCPPAGDNLNSQSIPQGRTREMDTAFCPHRDGNTNS